MCELQAQQQTSNSLNSCNKLSNNLIENSNKNLKKSVINDETLETKFFQCLICRNFSTSELTDMIEHLDMDRSRLYSGDIQVI